MGQSQKAAPQITQQLKPVQAEAGRQTQFIVAFTGDQPFTITWFRNGKEIKPSFEFQVRLIMVRILSSILIDEFKL